MTSTSTPDPYILLLALALLAPAFSTAQQTAASPTIDTLLADTVISQIIASNPQLSSMGPQVREMMRSPMMRQMM